jgi:LPS sulfotransferase NodH
VGASREFTARITPSFLIRWIAEGIVRPTQSGPNIGYTRLIVLSYQRSGSTMLVSALGSHTGCVCFSEIFNAARPMFWARGLNNNSRLLKAYRNAYPDRFLDRLIFSSYEQGIQMAGFKAFPEHVKDSRFAGLLRSLIAHPEVKVIHLKRRNKLAQYLSLVRARQNGVWSSNDGKQDDQRTICLDPRACRKAFERMEGDERFLDDLVRDRDVLTLVYEDFARDVRAWFERAQAHLGLSIEPIQPSLSRQRLVPLSEAITNYEELRREFAGTVWEGFFDRQLD